MFALKSGRVPVVISRVSFARSAAFAAILGLAGCASDPNARTAQNMSPQVVADATEMEDDGLPVQTAPPVRIRAQQVDPSEPFSPDYGGANPSAERNGEKPEEYYEQVPVPAHALAPDLPQDLPDDLPEEFRRKLVHAMAETE